MEHLLVNLLSIKKIVDDHPYLTIVLMYLGSSIVNYFNDYMTKDRIETIEQENPKTAALLMFLRAIFLDTRRLARAIRLLKKK